MMFLTRSDVDKYFNCDLVQISNSKQTQKNVANYLGKLIRVFQRPSTGGVADNNGKSIHKPNIEPGIGNQNINWTSITSISELTS